MKLVNLKKFTKEENYMPDDLKIDTKCDDYVIHTAMVNFGGKSARWIFYKKGAVFTFDIVTEGKKKVIKAEKVLDLGYTLN